MWRVKSRYTLVVNFLKKYKIKIILIILIVVLCSFAVYLENRPIRVKEGREYSVTKVYDGDTFAIKLGKREQKVRMLGIDTPETVDPRKPVQCFGLEASNKTKELLENQKVTLETDPTQGIFDKYERVLAYVYSNGVFINEYLLKNGYAHEYTYNLPYKNQKEFKSLETKAREDKVGLWGNICLNYE